MTCKDCMMFEVCEEFACFDEGIGDNTDFKICESFKDKSRFVELPCKYSDTIYSIFNGKYQEYKIKGFLYSKNGSYLVLGTIPKQEEHIYHQMYLNDFLFFTKEEAEKALKERESNA